MPHELLNFLKKIKFEFRSLICYLSRASNAGICKMDFLYTSHDLEHSWQALLLRFRVSAIKQHSHQAKY